MEIDFEKLGGLVPAIIQDAKTKNVLMLGFMNEEAYLKTIETGKVTFWSRSRNCLWTKGETSGNYLNLVSIQNDCDNDTLLVKVNPIGPTCHTGTDTCWGETNDSNPLLFLYLVLEVLEGCIQFPVALLLHHDDQEAQQFVADPSAEDLLRHSHLLRFGYGGVEHEASVIGIVFEDLPELPDLLKHFGSISFFRCDFIQRFAIGFGN